MFSKPKTKKPSNAQPSVNIPSLISPGSRLEGKLFCSGDLQVDGHVEGDIHSIRVAISEAGIVDGAVYAEEIVLRGKVKGNVYTKRIYINTNSHIEGNVYYEQMSVETGAFIDGLCKHETYKGASTETSEKTASKPEGSSYEGKKTVPLSSISGGRGQG